MLRRVNVYHLRGLCREYSLQRPMFNPNELLSVNYKDEPHRLYDVDRRYAYLGAPLHYLHRLLTLGRLDNNWAGPLRLYKHLEPALAQCTVSTMPMPANSWSHSRYGRAPRCVLICELIDRKLALRLLHQTELVIYDTSAIRVNHLLIYTEYPTLVQALAPICSVWSGEPSSPPPSEPIPGDRIQNTFSANGDGAARSRVGSCACVFLVMASWLGKRLMRVLPCKRSLH
ncbi:hypothetical protein KR222_007645 [Zaprionus bogoriensis]|nr:hypothetical protein KR222_007645 [Zaprionus bogoriensis]